MPMQIKALTCFFKQVKQIAKNSVEVVFEMKDDALLFKPGQYVRISNPRLDPMVKRGNTRDFTISSIPQEPYNVFSVAFRESPSEFKQALIHAKVDDIFLVEGPYGVFCLPEDSFQNLIFLAWGIGITPFVSMIRYSSIYEGQRLIHLVYIDSERDSFCYLDELELLCSTNLNLTLTIHKGKISVEDIKNYVAFDQKITWYLCGPPACIHDFFFKIISDLKVRPEDLRVEEYVGYDQNNPEYAVPMLSREVYSELNFKSIANEAFVAALLNAIEKTSLLSITDKYGRIIYVNRKFQEISKFSQEELLGQNHRILKSGHHTCEFYKQLWETISSGKAWRNDIKNRAKDGSLYWVDTTIIPIKDTNNIIEYYLAVRVLISDKKTMMEARVHATKIMEELNKEKNNLALLMLKYQIANEAQGCGIWSFDVAQQKMDWNENMCNLLKVDKKEVNNLLERWESLLREKGKSLWDGFLKEILEQKEVEPIELKVYLDDSNFCFLKCFAKFFPEGNLIVGTCQDISYEKEIESLKEDFLYLVVHQLKSPLATIKASAEFLTQQGKEEIDQAKQEELIQGINKVAIEAGKMMNKFLNISRIESGERTVNISSVNVKQLLEQLRLEVSAEYQEKEIKIHINDGNQNCLVETDLNFLREILSILLSNAVKYSSQKGEVNVNLSIDSNRLCCAFIDQGCGIPEVDHPKIFQKFFRSSNSQKQGSGFGLYVLKNMVELLKGTISFTSKENIGSTFVLEIPIKYQE